MPIFWPSCVAHLYVRFDGSYDVVEPAESPSTESELTKSQVFGPSNIRPLILQAQPKGGPQGLTGIMNRIPLSCSVDLPSYRQAGTFNMEIEYRDLPIDPRLIRSASVEIYMGAVDPNDFSTGMVSVESDGSRRSYLQTLTAGGMRAEDHLLIVGTVDSWHVTHNATGSRMSMTGRDLRGLLLDTKVDVRSFAKIDLTKNIVEVVRQILGVYPWGREWNVTPLEGDWIGEDGRTKIPSPAEKDGQTKVRQPVAKGGAGTSTPQGGEKLSFWDLITNYCFIVGAIPFFQADRIVIRRALNLFQQLNSPVGAPGTPFDSGLPRLGADGKTFKIRKMVYGRDVAECSFERKFGGVNVPTIQVESFDTSSDKRGAGKLLRVQFPAPQQPKKTGGGVSGGNSNNKPLQGKVLKNNATSPSGQPHQDILRIPVHGIRSKERLLDIAKSLYEEIGRGEMGGSVQTKSLASFGTDPNDPIAANADPDLLRLRTGDAVELLIDTRGLESSGPLVSSYTDSRRRSPREQEDEMAKRLGGNQAAKELARIITAQSNGSILQLQTIYRTNNVHFKWNNRSGIDIAFDFSNFVTARSDVAQVDPRSANKPGRKVRPSSSKNTQIGSKESSASSADKKRAG